jgi:hypothetical protein
MTVSSGSWPGDFSSVTLFHRSARCTGLLRRTPVRLPCVASESSTPRHVENLPQVTPSADQPLLKQQSHASSCETSARMSCQGFHIVAIIKPRGPQSFSCAFAKFPLRHRASTPFHTVHPGLGDCPRTATRDDLQFTQCNVSEEHYLRSSYVGLVPAPPRPCRTIPAGATSKSCHARTRSASSRLGEDLPRATSRTRAPDGHLRRTTTWKCPATADRPLWSQGGRRGHRGTAPDRRRPPVVANVLKQVLSAI